MEAEWIHKRIQLWHLLQDKPSYADCELAHQLKMSRAWVQKWRVRLVDADPYNLDDFTSHSRRRHQSPKKVTEPLTAKILHYRETLTEKYRRRVGARNILYHLQQDAELKRLGVYIPKSASTVHQVLVEYHCIPRPTPNIHIPMDRPEPMQVWEIDFTDIISAKSERADKKAHQVEVFDVVDAGSSVAIATTVSDQFDAKYALIAMLDVFQRGGMPQVIRMDRDPRLVGSSSNDIFPSAFMRTLLCLGVSLDICPPHRPDRKPFVERFIRTQKEESIYPRRPATVEQSQLWLDEHRSFYNLERPNQAISCNNQPPAIAIGTPPALRKLPLEVDVDAWLHHYHRYSFRRKVQSNGAAIIDRESYYIGKAYRGQTTIVVLDAQQRHLEFYVQHQLVKTQAIKNLYHGILNFEDFVEVMLKAAESESRRLERQQRLARRTA